jgi:hypothetical protein
MFRCYQCSDRFKEKERVIVGMNLCGDCAQENSDARKPAHGYLWYPWPPQYVLDELASYSDPVLAKKMRG